MAKTITQLPDATVVNAADELIIQQSGVTKRATKTELLSGIVNANIDASAAIAFSKLAALDSANILVGNGSNVATKVAVTGDVTISNAGVTAIAAGAVVTADVQDAAITAPKLSGAQTGSAPIYGCRAWVNFNGSTGSTVDSEFRCTINGSGNVSKVVRTATGDFTVYFTTAMPNANYAPISQTNYNDAGTANRTMNQHLDTAPTTSSCRFIVQSGVGVNENPTGAYVAFFG